MYGGTSNLSRIRESTLTLLVVDIDGQEDGFDVKDTHELCIETERCTGMLTRACSQETASVPA